MTHKRRAYYDHEGVYRRFREQGYKGWDHPNCTGKLDTVSEFLASKHAPQRGSVLDLGCGGGEVSIFLAQKGWEVVGIDYSETAIDMANENAQGLDLPIRFFIGDVTQPLPIERGCFTLVLDHHVRHCLIGEADRMSFMRNAFNSLEEGGFMLSAGHSAEGYLNYSAANGIDPETHVDVYHTRYWATLRELTQEFWTVGFDIRYINLQQELPEDELGAEVTIYAVKPVCIS
ncbi:MAG: class I SAM-dependent methyltransferase [Armatimonadota bacterium]